VQGGIGVAAPEAHSDQQAVAMGGGTPHNKRNTGETVMRRVYTIDEAVI